MLTLVVLEGFVIALLVVLVAGLLRSHKSILRQLHELRAGEHHAPDGAGSPSPTPPPPPASDIAGHQPDGDERTISLVGTDHPTVLAFLSSGCRSCQAFWTRFNRPEPLEMPLPGTRLVIVTNGPERESESAISSLAPESAPTLMSSEAFRRYRVPGSPYFVLVDGPTGSIVGEGSGTSWDQVNSLLRSTLADVGT